MVSYDLLLFAGDKGLDLYLACSGLTLYLGDRGFIRMGKLTLSVLTRFLEELFFRSIGESPLVDF